VDPDGFTTFTNRLGSAGGYLLENQINHSCIDLRTAEQQLQVPAQGWALVLANVRPPEHNQIMQTPETHEVNLSTTPQEVAAIIGDEATDELLDPSNVETLKDYFARIHKRRVDRWKGR
jgi:hypothetical protein